MATDLWSVQRQPEALWTLNAVPNPPVPEDVIDLHLKTANVQGFSPWTLVGLIWPFRIAVPATRVNKLFFWTELFGAGREDCMMTSQPMEALLFFRGAHFNTANLIERNCPHIQSFLAHCCFFISQLSFLYERPHIAVTTKKALFDFFRSSRILFYLL